MFVPEKGIFLISFFQQEDKPLVVSDVCLIISAQIHLDYFSLLELLFHRAFSPTKREALATHSFHLFS